MKFFLGGYTPGFRGSVRFRMGLGYDGITHAVSRRNHHMTVCGVGISSYDDAHMSGNNEMNLITCVRCWTTKDPFP